MTEHHDTQVEHDDSALEAESEVETEGLPSDLGEPADQTAAEELDAAEDDLSGDAEVAELLAEEDELDVEDLDLDQVDGDDDSDDDEATDEAEAVAEPKSPQDRMKQLEVEGDIAADYLEELLDIADLDGDLDMDVEGDRAAVSIVGTDLDALVGDDGRVLESLQELTRLAVYRETGERSRLMLDIGGYRADVRKSLVALAEEAIEEVKETGEAVKLAPMSPFERKVVHDAVAEGGLRSESEGVEPTRCVVILPTS